MEGSVIQSKWQAYSHLMRINKPIGTLLLLWPTLWALWIAGQGVPSLSVLVVFVAGVFMMRAAGCVVNDYADRAVDGHVKRTAGRPMPSGRVSEKEAKILFVVLVLVSFGLVLTLNAMTIWLSLAALALAWVYPFMKRVTHLPQFVLGRGLWLGHPDGLCCRQRVTATELLAVAAGQYLLDGGLRHAVCDG